MGFKRDNQIFGGLVTCQQPPVLGPFTVATLPPTAPNGSLAVVTDDPVSPLYVRLAGVWAPYSKGSESVADITLAVSATGSDSDPARPSLITGGDWSAYPFATAQAARDVLPSRIVKTHKVTINVGAGTFVGFNLGNILLFTSATYGIILAGTRATAVLATGPTSGTATSGSNRTLVVTGAGWTPGDLEGRFARITAGTGAGQILLIAQNTADTLTLAAIASPALNATSQFEIEDVVTVIEGVPPSNPAYIVGVTEVPSGQVELRDLKVSAVAKMGLNAYRVAYLTLRRVVSRYVSGFCFSGMSVSNSGSVFLTQSGSFGAFVVGCSCQNMDMISGSVCSVGASGSGFNANNAGGWTFLTGGLYAKRSTYGIETDRSNVWAYDPIIENCTSGVYSQKSFVDLRNAVINNCTDPFRMVFTGLRLYGSLGGSGNTNFGLQAKGSGNTVQLEGITPTIAGGLGDASVDGVTPILWSSLSVVGNYAVDAATGARINRQ